MTLFVVSLLIVLQSVIILAQKEQCPGRFNGQPCINSEGKSGACFGVYPPCAVGYPCMPFYMCQTDQKPLSNECAEVGARCLIGDVKASSEGSCQQRSATSISCVAREAETTTPSTTTVPETTSTGVSEQERFTACANLQEKADCKLRGNPGKCLYSPPMQKSRKRLRIALRCYETEFATTTTTKAETKATSWDSNSNSNDNSLCKGLKEGDKCDNNGRCTTQGGNELKCVVDRDTEPNSSNTFVASISLVMALLVFIL
jgi:hypothetical protein